VEINHEGREEYINSRIFFFENNLLDLDGTHKYEFEYDLDASLPASFYNEECEITYNVSALLDIPLGVSKTVTKNFTVIRRDSPTHFPNLLIPASYEEIKIFCCWCCKSEPFIMNVSIPQSIYSAGDSIPVKIKYSNKSTVKIESTKIWLLRKLEYTVKTPEQDTRSDKKTVMEKTYRGINSESDEEFQYDFVVPTFLPPSIEELCKIIKISYILYVEAVPEGFHMSVDCEFPIVLLKSLSQTTTLNNYSNIDFLAPSAPTEDDDDKRKYLVIYSFLF
jgi:Arrestin (or S-antigen), C-terminal domain/Arrestin (or S-antigen), N-terminal domain